MLACVPPTATTVRSPTVRDCSAGSAVPPAPLGQKVEDGRLDIPRGGGGIAAVQFGDGDGVEVIGVHVRRQHRVQVRQTVPRIAEPAGIDENPGGVRFNQECGVTEVRDAHRDSVPGVECLGEFRVAECRASTVSAWAR